MHVYFKNRPLIPMSIPTIASRGAMLLNKLNNGARQREVKKGE